MLRQRSKLIYADDATESAWVLMKIRIPWLIVGLMLGLATTLIISRFEMLISSEVRLSFFIPIIVYLSDAVGTQTETIYVRNMNKKGRPSLANYLLKELMVGSSFGLIFGAAIFLFTFVWFKSYDIALTIGLAMCASITSACLLAVLVCHFLKQEHQDPAVSSGPITTVIQDLISLLIYFLIAVAIIF